MSRNVTSASRAIFEVCSPCSVHPSAVEKWYVPEHRVSCQSSLNGSDCRLWGQCWCDFSGSHKNVRAWDPTYVKLAGPVIEGFPSSRRMTDPLIKDFWEVRHGLSTEDGLILLDRRIVVPVRLHKRMIRCLHSAHQGVVGMKYHANEEVLIGRKLGPSSCVRERAELFGKNDRNCCANIWYLYDCCWTSSIEAQLWIPHLSLNSLVDISQSVYLFVFFAPLSRPVYMSCRCIFKDWRDPW